MGTVAEGVSLLSYDFERASIGFWVQDKKLCAGSFRSIPGSRSV